MDPPTHVWAKRLWVWSCIHVLEGPQIKDHFILNWENNKIEQIWTK